MIIRISTAIVGVSAILGSVVGVAQTAAGALAARELTLSASSASASRTIGADGTELRPNTTYELISNKTRPKPNSPETDVAASEQLTVLARVKTDSRGKFSTRFVVPLRWRHDHLIEVRKVKGADLVEQAQDWITVTPPRPALALSTGKVHAGSRVGVTVSGLRADTKYEVFSGMTRMTDDPESGGGGEDPPALRSFRTDDNGRASVRLTVPDDWRQDYLIEVRKMKGQTLARGANAWLTVVP